MLFILVTVAATVKPFCVKFFRDTVIQVKKGGRRPGKEGQPAALVLPAALVRPAALVLPAACLAHG